MGTAGERRPGARPHEGSRRIALAARKTNSAPGPEPRRRRPRPHQIRTILDRNMGPGVAGSREARSRFTTSGGTTGGRAPRHPSPPTSAAASVRPRRRGGGTWPVVVHWPSILHRGVLCVEIRAREAGAVRLGEPPTGNPASHRAPRAARTDTRSHSPMGRLQDWGGASGNIVLLRVDCVGGSGGCEKDFFGPGRRNRAGRGRSGPAGTRKTSRWLATAGRVAGGRGGGTMKRGRDDADAFRSGNRARRGKAPRRKGG